MCRIRFHLKLSIEKGIQGSPDRSRRSSSGYFPSADSGASFHPTSYCHPHSRHSLLGASHIVSGSLHHCCINPGNISFASFLISQHAGQGIESGTSGSESLPYSRGFLPADCVPNVGPRPTRSGPPDCISIWRGRNAASVRLARGPRRRSSGSGMSASISVTPTQSGGEAPHQFRSFSTRMPQKRWSGGVEFQLMYACESSVM